MTLAQVLTVAAAWLGFGLGVINIAFTFKRWRFDRESIEPEVTIDIIGDTIRRDTIAKDGAWVLLRVKMLNVDKFPRTLSEIRAVKPAKVALAPSSAVWAGSLYSDLQFRGQALSDRSSTATIAMTVAPAGSTRHDGRPSNSGEADFYLFIPDEPSPPLISSYETLEFRCAISSSHRMRSARSLSIRIFNTVPTTPRSIPR